MLTLYRYMNKWVIIYFPCANLLLEFLEELLMANNLMLEMRK